MTARWFPRALAGWAAVAVLLLGAPAAHAAGTALAGSDPADGGRLARGRDALVLRFTAAVDPGLVPRHA